MIRSRAWLHALICGACVSICLAGCTPRARSVESPAPQSAAAPAPRVEPEPSLAPNGITREAQDQNPPGPPGSIKVERRDGNYVVEWNGTRDDTIQGYQVFRRRKGEAWQAIAIVKLYADDEQNRGTYRYEERVSEDLEFTVAALDARGKPGPKTSEIH